jgi:hypothetical protein
VELDPQDEMTTVSLAIFPIRSNKISRAGGAEGDQGRSFAHNTYRLYKSIAVNGSHRSPEKKPGVPG